MRWGTGLLSLVMVAGLASCATPGSGAHTGGAVIRPRSVAGNSVSPRDALRRVPACEHAGFPKGSDTSGAGRFVAGPAHGRQGVFAACLRIRRRTGIATHDPRATVTFLRWRHGRWSADGRLRAVHAAGFWDIPSNGIRAGQIRGLDREAPVFTGTEGGGGGVGTMIAYRVAGGWRWAWYDGCALPGPCPASARRSDTVENGRIVHRRLLSIVNDCNPSCGSPDQKVYRDSWAWNADRHEFRLAGRRLIPHGGGR